MTPTPYSGTEVLALTFRDGKFDPARVLALYADPANWRQVGDGKDTPCQWLFTGPLLPGYALAQRALEALPSTAA
jgi:hypothetical protein